MKIFLLIFYVFSRCGIVRKHILEVGVNSVKNLNLGNLFVDDNKIELIKTDYIAPLQKEINK